MNYSINIKSEWVIDKDILPLCKEKKYSFPHAFYISKILLFKFMKEKKKGAFSPLFYQKKNLWKKWCN
jgi:hypothetical protein